MNSEQDYLRGYSMEQFARPSVTTDIAVFALRTEGLDNFRKDPVRRLSLLLVRRGEHPFRDCWALPGGFLRMDETVEDCALRELKEETGVPPAALVYTGVFSALDRDPRGRIISNAFICVLNEAPPPRAGSDAADARWFDVDFAPAADGTFSLVLTSGDVTLTARLKEAWTAFGTALHETSGRSALAFDHAAIITSALRQLREKAAAFELIFDFLPEMFTLNDLQQAQEAITGVPVAVANFRRKAAPFVKETGVMTQGAGHRPAMLFSKKTSS
ncbi:MAG: NUDIX hydrolase [Clostridia bacterium]|nr:NUDIX hydrolase [Clostridia bacterium]